MEKEKIKKKLEVVKTSAISKGFDPMEIEKFEELILNSNDPQARRVCGMMVDYLKGFPASLIWDEPIEDQLDYLNDFIINNKSFGTNMGDL